MHQIFKFPNQHRILSSCGAYILAQGSFSTSCHKVEFRNVLKKEEEEWHIFGILPHLPSLKRFLANRLQLPDSILLKKNWKNQIVAFHLEKKIQCCMQVSSLQAAMVSKAVHDLDSHDIGIHFTVFSSLLLMTKPWSSTVQIQFSVKWKKSPHRLLPTYQLDFRSQGKKSLIIICHVLAFGNYYQKCMCFDFRGRFSNFFH